MKKLSNKKGLFLAEILLAVVIAAVIMGSGYLLYADIQSENQKNKATANLQALIAKMTVIYGENPITAGSATDEAKVHKKTKDIPATILSQSGSHGDVNSAYGKAIFIGAIGKNAVAGGGLTNGTSNWFVTYDGLSDEQCAKFLPGINKTQPIAIMDGAGTAGKFKVTANALVGNGGCASGAASGPTGPFRSKRELIGNGKMCANGGTKNNLTVVYSPSKHTFAKCVAQ